MEMTKKSRPNPLCVFCDGPTVKDPDIDDDTLDSEDPFQHLRLECESKCRGPKESKLVLCSGDCNETHYDSSATSYHCYEGMKHLSHEQHKRPRLYCQSCYFKSPCYLRPFACDLDQEDDNEICEIKT